MSSEQAEAVAPASGGPWRRRDRTVAAVADAPTVDARPVVLHVVERPRLYALLEDTRDVPVTLVAGPAGWGKTLLTASWVSRGAGGRASAWVTLGPGDDDPAAFWGRLARAVGTAVGPATAEALAPVTAPGTTVAELPGLFAHALGRATRPLVLVLDDLHEVGSPAVHEGLLRLVRRPVGSLRLLVTTRHDPPWPRAQLRLAGLLAEVRTTELAFRDDEALALFDRLGIPATGSQVAEMVRRTDGWAGGLRLAALDLGARGDVAEAVRTFSGDNHGVSDYLLAEVLDRQPPEIVTFLRDISAVDLVCADLARALTGRDDAERVLAELAGSHLFVQALGRPGRWYRLHRLLLDVLRTRPRPRRERRDGQRRATEWFRAHGMPLEALRAAVDGELWRLAADVAGTHIITLLLRGSVREVDRLLGEVPQAVLLEHPELATLLTGARASRGHVRGVRPLLTAAERRCEPLTGARGERLRVQHAVIEGALARAAGDLDAMVRAYRSVPLDPVALARWGMADTGMIPTIVLGNLGAAEYWTGDLEAAAEHLAEIAEPAGAPALPDLNAAAHLALLACEHGELPVAEDRARAVADAADARGWSRTPQVAAAYLALARLALDRDETESADRWLARVADVEETAPEPQVRLAQALALATRRESAGDREGALSGLRLAAADLRPWTPPRPLREESVLAEATILARGGNVGAARHLLDELGPVRTAAGIVAAGHLRRRLGEPAATTALTAAVTDRRPRLRAGAGIVLALDADAAGDGERALAHLEEALRAAAPVGLRRPFLEEPEVAELLDRRVERGSAASAFAMDLLERLRGTAGNEAARPLGHIDPLTEREGTMLRYLASTLSNAEIASELYVSVNTVKTHQRAVYRKLGVAGRRAAVLRARAMALL